MEILELRSEVEAIRDALLAKVGNANEPTWGVGKDCVRTGEALTSLLENQVLPDNYKVAVVGRFKAGKSSFVNELLGAKLAGEDTSPETAAVTTFVHGNEVKATIRFTSLESWLSIRRLFSEDPKHVDAHRVKMWESFSDKPKKKSDGDVVEVFDLPALEREFIRENGHTVEIRLDASGGKSSENAFRRKLKDFTSGTRPLHCLVEGIEISSPAPILDEGVMLIDTPGLDDTERFRVTLTEKAVEDVDAVLFLTKSGAAYGQSEKDFLLTLLRKGTVKQLIFVITQVDQTYEQHVRNADSNDEDPETIAARIAKEERRIRDEIEATLDELSEEDSPAMRRYREQLGEVGLAFTSATNHRDWSAGKEVSHKIHRDDPGGIERMKRQLLVLLSTESRLSLVAHNIANGAKSALEELLGVINNRRTALKNIKDGEVAEQKLANFRFEFDSAREKFESAALGEFTLLRKNLDERHTQNAHLIETIGLLAERELSIFENWDVSKHWKTRRSGYWGYMQGLQAKVANKIFPKVQQLLSELTSKFAVFADHVEKHLSALSASGSEIAVRIDVGPGFTLDLTKTISGSLAKSLSAAGELIADEEQRIVSFLDNFVSDEVDEKISASLERVSNVFGRGTTAGQSQQVRAFYSEVKALLQEALRSHLEQRSNAFGDFLVVEATAVPRNAIAEVQAVIANAEHDIRAAVMAQIGGLREVFEKECEAVCEEIARVSSSCARLVGETAPEEPPKGLIAGAERCEPSDEGDDWFEKVISMATDSVERMRLMDGDSGWTTERIFQPDLVKGCSKVALIDPYLAQHHQVRNLKEFLITVAEAAKPKEILVLTSGTWLEGSGANERAANELAVDLFRNFGTTLDIRVDHTIHDRFVAFDHGLMYKLGRGLDIYKPAIGLGSHRPGNRRVRRTDIDVYRVPKKEAGD